MYLITALIRDVFSGAMEYEVVAAIKTEGKLLKDV